MEQNLIKTLIERLGRVTTVLKRNNDSNPYLENRNKLIGLLTDHPQFIDKIEKIRVEYTSKGLPISAMQDAFLWEQNHKQEVQELRKEITTFVSEYAFNSVYKADIEEFVYDLVVCPVRAENPRKTNVPSVMVVDTDENKNVNAHLITPNARYVQIFDWTSLKDIQDNWSKIKGEAQNADLEVSQTEPLSKTIWKLKLSGFEPKDIAREINNHHKYLLQDISGGVLGEDTVRVYLHRYSVKLKKLKPF